MFFIQRQLSENECGQWAEMPAYFYLIGRVTRRSGSCKLLNLTKINL